MKFKPLYLWTLLPVLVIVGWIIAFYTPVSSKNQAREGEMVRMKAERLTMEKEISRLAALRKKEGETQTKIDNVSANIPRYEDLPAFMKEVAAMARGKGIYVDDMGSLFSSMEDRQAKAVANPVFEITVKGRYLQIGRFLEELEKNKAFKGVLKASLVYDEKQYPVLTGKFVIQFKARRE